MDHRESKDSLDGPQHPSTHGSSSELKLDANVR